MDIAKIHKIDLLFGTYTEEEQRKDAYRLKNREMKLIEQMELHHSKKVSSKQLTVVYTPARTVMQFDSKTFRTENEALYAQYCKPHEKEASIVVRRTVQRASD